MNQNQALFIGYETLEEWLQSVDKTRPVYSSLVADAGSQEAAHIHITMYRIVVSQASEDGTLVQYCRLPVAQVRYIDERPFDDDANHRMEQAQGASRIIEDWLTENSLKVAHGVIATPKDMVFMDGWATFLEFDRGNQIYIRVGKRKRKSSRTAKT